VSKLSVSFLQMPHAAGLPAPAYATADAAGMDLSAAVEDDAPVTLAPGQRAAIPTGLQLAIPQGFEGQVRPRSGLALKNAVTVLNAPGTIDADYRGEVKVILINLGTEPFEITRGMRIAQLVFAPVVRATMQQAATLDETARGEGGFGSTGVAKRAAG
jgi:dUTP pyrophosphatase